MLFAPLAALAAASLNCAEPASLQAAWTPAVQAYRAGDTAKAKQVTDEIIAACGKSPLADVPRVMRAEIALKEGDHEGALVALGPRARPAPPPVGPYSSFIALQALAGKKDADGFARERARLVDGAARALTGRLKGRLVEAFEAGTSRVTAIEASFPNGRFQRHFVFLVAPGEPFALPRSIMLTTTDVAKALGGPQVYYLDEYGCDGHRTLELIPERKPDYPTLKAKVEARLKGEGSAVSSMTPPGGGCAFADYVAPGIGGVTGR